jgi:hypothetical protein
MSADRSKERPQRCVGCEEPRCTDTTKVEGLGYVCASCMEVLPLVWETEIERVRTARRTVEAAIESLAPDRER